MESVLKRSGMSKPRRLLLQLLAVAVIIAIMGGIVRWRISGSLEYDPPFVPVAFIIDNTGQITIQTVARIVTWVGDFAITAGAEQTVEIPDNGILVIIRHKVDEEIKDAVYAVHTDSDQIMVTLDGKTVVQVTNKRVFIDASQGAVTQIVLTKAGTEIPTIPGSGTIAYCLQLPEFQDKAAFPNLGPDFSDVPVMAGSVGYLEKSFYDGTYHFLLFDICTEATDPNTVRTFFARALTTNGWEQSDTFPYAGDPNRGCGDPYCWVRGSDPTRYVSLEKVQHRGDATTYQFRLGIL